MGLRLYLILINLCGFKKNYCSIGDKITRAKGKFIPETLHTKFIDDLTIVESINVKETLVPNVVRILPDNFNDRFGLKLPEDKSKVYD